MVEDLLDVALRDVLDIPETVTSDDFVMQLDRGVEHSTATVRQYVVTDGISDAMGQALDLVRKTVNEHSTSGAFVHGSFGSGKSHFMAVLHLLLAGNAGAAALPGLQAVVASHSDVLAKRFLLLDFHLLGKASMEQAIFGGYLDAVADSTPTRLCRCCTSRTGCWRTRSGCAARWGGPILRRPQPVQRRCGAGVGWARWVGEPWVTWPPVLVAGGGRRPGSTARSRSG